MEFMKEFAVIQGTMLSLQKKVGALKTITRSVSGSETMIKTVVDTVIKVLKSFETTNLEEYDSKLHKISLFLVFNSDIKACQLLVEDPHCGHLVDSAPTISRDILIDLLSEPLLRKFFHELVLHCPPCIGIELLETVLEKMKKDSFFQNTSCFVTFTRAVYVKLLHCAQNEKCDHDCEIHCAAQKFMYYYVKLLELPILENTDSAVERFGHMIKLSLELVSSCVASFIHPEEVDANLLALYKMHIPFDYRQWHQQPKDDLIMDSIHLKLFYFLVVQMEDIVVDVWLEWAELESRTAYNCSMQKDIAEEMFKCHEIILAAKNKGMNYELLNILLTMLSSMARKPRDEDDDIQEADIPLILSRIPDQMFSQRKWLLALFTKSDDVLLKEECIDCIKNHINLVDMEISLIFLDRMYYLLQNGEQKIDLDGIKIIFLSAVSHLRLEEQLQLLQTFFEKFGMNTHLCSHEYNSKLTKVFNTAVDSSVLSQEKYVEFINLSFQNPMDVLKKILNHAVASNKQAHIMGDILLILKPFHSLQITKNDQETCNVLIDAFYEIMQKKNTLEFSDLSFISLVTFLANNYVLPVNDFLQCNLLPLLHSDLIERKWSSVALWLETLQVFVNGTVEVQSNLQVPALLLFLGQILELSRKSLFSFSSSALLACEQAINIISILFDNFHFNAEGDNLDNIRGNVIKLFSPINQYYFFNLWSKNETYTHFTADLKVYLLHRKNVEKCNIKSPWAPQIDSQRKKILLEITQLLAICTQNEWRTITQNFKNHLSSTSCINSCFSVFEYLIDAIQVMTLLSSSSDLRDDERECSWSCLDYCIRNLSILAKEEIFEEPELLPAQLTCNLFQKVIHLNCLLPVNVRDSCSGNILNLLVDLISCASSEMLMNSNDEKHFSQNHEILRSFAITVMLVEDTKMRQALARKLQDMHSIVSEANNLEL